MISRFEQFTFVVSAVYRHIQKLERDEMVKYGYKGAFAQYLLAIARHPDGITCRGLCELCDKDKAAVSRIVSEMEEKGLVVREGHNERLYNASVKLTERGRAAADYVLERAGAAVDAVGMTEEERAIFYDTFQHIAAKLHTLSKTGIPDRESKENNE